MKQAEFFLQGFGLRLRPVELGDAEFIVQQRRHPRAKAYLGETSPSVDRQKSWIALQRKRQNDLYFLCEVLPNTPVGTIGLYDIGPQEAVWGRFVLHPQYNAAVQSLILLFDYAFETRSLASVRCTVVADNAKARALYEWVGHTRLECATPDAQIDGRNKTQVTYTLSARAWLAHRAKVYQVGQRGVQMRQALP